MEQATRIKDEKRRIECMETDETATPKRSARDAFGFNQYQNPASPTKDVRSSLDQVTKHRRHPMSFQAGSFFHVNPTDSTNPANWSNPPNTSNQRNPNVSDILNAMNIQISSVYHMFMS